MIVTEVKKRITKKFGNGHTGVDVGYRNNESENVVYAHSDGVVVFCQTRQKLNRGSSGNASYGNCVKIKHPNGFYTLYAHLSSVDVKLNQNVKKGQKIGIIGETGNAYGRHLHFEVRNTKNTCVDPVPYLDSDFNVAKVITYQAHDSKYKWNPNVKAGTNDYAGNFGISIDAIYIDNLTYRVHDKVKNMWLPWVAGRKDYAGNLGNAIDGLQIKNATYRVHLKNGGWLSWISKVDNTSSGYAGIIGKEIDAIQIKG